MPKKKMRLKNPETGAPAVSADIITNLARDAGGNTWTLAVDEE